MGTGIPVPVLEPSAAGNARALSSKETERVRVGESSQLHTWLRMVIVPGLEQLADSAGDPADLRALACRQARRLRTELEATAAPENIEPLTPAERRAREDEREWVRCHLHDTALQILEFIAGDGFGTGLEAQKIARLAGRAARDMQRWIAAGEQPRPQLVPLLERVTAEARTVDPGVRLVVGELGRQPTREQVSALGGAVREAVTNARKHARASQVVIRVSAGEDGSTAVTVTDDGVGFDPDCVGGGLGLQGSIFGRMQRAGGSASLDRPPGGGTRVTLRATAREAP